MTTLKITHFFDVIKKEPNFESESATFMRNNASGSIRNIKSECYIKEEVDISWDDISYNVDRDNCQHDMHWLEKYSNMFNARVLIHKLPDSTIQKYCKQSEIRIIENQDDTLGECSTDIVQEENVEKENRSLRNNNHKSQMDLKETDDNHESKFYWKICATCNKKHEVVLLKRKMHECQQCKNRLMFECKKCHKQLSTVGGMKWHVRSKCSDMGYYYKCLECGYKSVARNAIACHVKKKHPTMTSQLHCLIEKVKTKNVQEDLGRAKHQCSKCEQKFVFLPRLMRHLLICTGTQSVAENEHQNVNNDILDVRNLILLYCKECDKDVMYSTMIKSRLQKGKKMCVHCKSIMAFKCLECKKQCGSRHGMAAHIRATHFTKKEYKCLKCDFKTCTVDNLSRHYNRMHIIEIHECSKCGRKYDTHCRLRKHLEQCGLEPQYNCEHCPYKTHIKASLVHHILRMHSPLNEIECSNCKKIQRNEQCLKEHSRMCKMKDYLRCQFCSYKTKYITLLHSHTSRLHAEGKNVFTVMGRSGKYYKYMSNYQCDHCSYQCHTKSLIYHHIVRNHLKEKNIECSKCGKKFKNSVYLNAHLKYCGSKSYVYCAHCPFQTHLKSKLSVHMQNRHLNFECSRCKRIIKGKENCRVHCKKRCKRRRT